MKVNAGVQVNVPGWFVQMGHNLDYLFGGDERKTVNNSRSRELSLFQQNYPVNQIHPKKIMEQAPIFLKT